MTPALDTPTAWAFGAVFLIVFALVWRRPIAGPLALFGTLPFDGAHAIGPTTLGAPKIVLIAGWLALAFRRIDMRALARPPARMLLLSAFAVLAATALSALAASDRGEALRQTLKALEFSLALGLGIVAFRADPDLRIVRAAVTATGLAVSGLAVVDLFSGKPVSVAPIGSFVVPRIAGPLEGPNQLAAYLGLIVPFALAFAIRDEATWLERVTTAAAGAALVLTLSRSGIITGAFVAALVIAVAFAESRAPGTLRRRVAGLTVATGLVAIAGIVALANVAGDPQSGLGVLLGRLTLEEPEHTGAVGHRAGLWRAAWHLFVTHPWLGVGAGNFQDDVAATGLPGVKTHANSLYLQALVEGGVPLLAATLWFMWNASVPLLRRVREGGPLVTGVAAASAGLALHQIVDLLIFYPKVGESWCVLLGLAAATLVARRETIEA